MAMSEEMEVLKEVARRLDQAGIAYMITGSTAANFYTVPRMTRDIDLVVELTGEDVNRVVEIFTDDFYVDRQAVEEAINRKSMFNLIHTLANVPSPFGISDVQRLCPNVSRDMIRVVMNRWRKEGRLKAIGRGRDAQWACTEKQKR